MLRANGQQKKRNEMVITRTDKGSEVVILERTEYVTMSLLKELSISDVTKFIFINLETPKEKGIPPKHSYPPLKKEKEPSSIE